MSTTLVSPSIICSPPGLLSTSFLDPEITVKYVTSFKEKAKRFQVIVRNNIMSSRRVLTKNQSTEATLV